MVFGKDKRDATREIASIMIRWRDVELPGFVRRLRPVSRKRRNVLAAHLHKVLADVLPPASKKRAPSHTNPTSNFSDACRACRGYCCRNGGDTAYLDEQAISLAWTRHPDLGRARLLSLYIEAIPHKAFENSCIFHAKDGCALPRTLRAPVCEAFLCDPLLKLKSG